MQSKLILVTGGARSGKSTFANRLASRLSKRITYIATCKPLDKEMTRRIKQHRKLRASLGWKTIEEPKDIVRAIKDSKDTNVILIDCLTLWVSNLLLEGLTERKVLNETRLLTKAINRSSKDTIVVSNEVGMGIVPDTKLGRQFRDIAGLVNQVLAEAADEVYFLISGLPIKLKGYHYLK